MSRFSKAGVEMITLAMGQMLFSKFAVPPEGQMKVTDAISKLKSYSSLGKVLWFGFGVKHVVRSLCEIEQGVVCAGICACLSVSYGPETRSRVLQSMCNDILGGGELAPSLPQWGALIDVCSGALANSKFPDLVEGFCRLGRSKFQGVDESYRSSQIQTGFFLPTSAKDLGVALLSLSKVSDGTYDSITIYGGIDCGWLAAVAEWLFCLKIDVLTTFGEFLYRSRAPNEASDSQVVIVYSFEPTIPSRSVQVIDRTLRLKNGGLHLLNRRPDFGPNGTHLDQEMFSFGRSSWPTILEETFGNAFRHLISPPACRHFAVLLTACLPFGPSLYKRYETWELLNPWLASHTSRSHGRQEFFRNAIQRLPELQPLTYHVDQAIDEERHGKLPTGLARDLRQLGVTIFRFFGSSLDWTSMKQ